MTLGYRLKPTQGHLTPPPYLLRAQMQMRFSHNFKSFAHKLLLDGGQFVQLLASRFDHDKSNTHARNNYIPGLFSLEEQTKWGLTHAAYPWRRS